MMGMWESYIVVGVLSINVFFLVYWIYKKTRPKKMTWTARCYQMAEGTRKHKSKSKEYELHDLKPYCIDTIERIDAENSKTIFRLQKQNISLNEVTADNIENWGKTKEVSVLIQEGTATIMKKGYDSEGNMIFQPMPRSRIELMRSDLVIKKERNMKEKSLLMALMPYVAIVMGLITIMFMVHSIAKINTENNQFMEDMIKQFTNSQKDASNVLSDGMKQSSAMFSKQFQALDSDITALRDDLNNQKINKPTNADTYINAPSIE